MLVCVRRVADDSVLNKILCLLQECRRQKKKDLETENAHLRKVSVSARKGSALKNAIEAGRSEGGQLRGASLKDH